MTPNRTHLLPFIFLLLVTTLFLLLVTTLVTTLPFSGGSDTHSVLPITPERSAVLHVKKLNIGNFTINKNSVEAIQKIEFNNRVLVLVQYIATRHGNGVENCEVVLETEKDQAIRWNTGSGMCHKINDPNETTPITVGSTRGGSTPQDPGYTTVYGMIRDPQITQIVVTWEDGNVQPVEVQESAYMAAREGELDMKKVEAFNGQNELVYTTERQG
jgi:hypothetical protein